MPQDDWTETTKRLLKAEMTRTGVTYEEMAKRLGAIGEVITPESLRVKVSRGGFSAVFMVQCLTVMGVKDLRIQ